MRAKLPDESLLVECDGARIHCEVFGRGRQTLLFLPAWAIVHSRFWKAQIATFSRDYRCIAFDPRGNGKSDKPASLDDYSLDKLVDDALAVMDATSTRSAVLIGVSLGSLYGSIMASRHPDRVDALISICPASPIGPDYGYINPEQFFGDLDRHDGWDKYNRTYWHQEYRDFARFFIEKIHTEPHSTKQIEDGFSWSQDTTGDVLSRTIEARLTIKTPYAADETMYRGISCPALLMHGTDDQIQPHDRGKYLASLMGAEFVSLQGSGHNPQARHPAKINLLISEFLERRLKLKPRPLQRVPGRATPEGKRVLYLSSPIGLGHGRRDLAIARELRQLHPDITIDWLAQDPVTRFLSANDEVTHPASRLLVNESAHIEAEAGEHDLHCFQALRRMDEILIANFMVFQRLLDEQDYDLVIADEAWDIDHYWHEHPELKRAQLAWMTDFVGFIPMPSGGDDEALLTRDYNQEMISHINDSPGLRDRAIFVGNPQDIVPNGFGKDLPSIKDWTQSNFDFSGYITGYDPRSFGARDQLRERLGYLAGEKICIVTVGGSGVGGHLLKRVMDAFPAARKLVPELRMVVVTGPRIDPRSINAPRGVELRAFVPDLHQHLSACDLAIVQGGLTTCMELAAAQTPFLYFPLKNHFEQNFHVHHRLQAYGAGTRMDFDEAAPDQIAEAIVRELASPANWREVETDGAQRAARMLSELV